MSGTAIAPGGGEREVADTRGAGSRGGGVLFDTTGAAITSMGGSAVGVAPVFSRKPKAKDAEPSTTGADSESGAGGWTDGRAAMSRM